MGILYGFNNSLIALHKICDQLPENSLGTKTKWQKIVTQVAVICHLVLKSALFV